MGRYYLNGLDLEKYGFVPGHANNSNIALSGAWSLPKRLGDCYYEWPKMNGVEPFVDAEDIRFAGRDLELHGAIRGKNRDEFLINLSELHNALRDLSASELVVLKTDDFGNYNVLVKDIIKTTYLGDGVGNIVIKLREPVVDLSGEMPVGSFNAGNRIDGILLSDIGLLVSEHSGIDDRPAIKNQNFTEWQHEGFQVTTPKARTLEFKMAVSAMNYADFRFKVGQYYRLLGGAGVRYVTINDETEALFAINGFTISDIVIQKDVSAIMKIKMIDGYILNEHILCDDDTDIVIGENDDLIIAYYE